MDELRTLRERLAELESRWQRLARPGTIAGWAGVVRDGGNMPASVPGVFLVQPGVLAWPTAAGAEVQVEIDPAAPLVPVLFVSGGTAPAESDLALVLPLGRGRWVGLRLARGPCQMEWLVYPACDPPVNTFGKGTLAPPAPRTLDWTGFTVVAKDDQGNVIDTCVTDEIQSGYPVPSPGCYLSPFALNTPYTFEVTRRVDALSVEPETVTVGPVTQWWFCATKWLMAPFRYVGPYDVRIGVLAPGCWCDGETFQAELSDGLNTVSGSIVRDPGSGTGATSWVVLPQQPQQPTTLGLTILSGPAYYQYPASASLGVSPAGCPDWFAIDAQLALHPDYVCCGGRVARRRLFLSDDLGSTTLDWIDPVFPPECDDYLLADPLCVWYGSLTYHDPNAIGVEICEEPYSAFRYSGYVRQACDVTVYYLLVYGVLSGVWTLSRAVRGFPYNVPTCETSPFGGGPFLTGAACQPITASKVCTPAGVVKDWGDVGGSGSVSQVLPCGDSPVLLQFDLASSLDIPPYTSGPAEVTS